jgi:hypothetical protein
VSIASPDRSRIAFKKRLGGSGGWWQLSLCDLSTHGVRALAGDTEASTIRSSGWTRPPIYFRPNSDGNIIWRLPADSWPARRSRSCAKASRPRWCASLDDQASGHLRPSLARRRPVPVLPALVPSASG